MKGLILAGGYATRLRPLSCSKPKLLFPIVGVPLINHMIDWLKTAGVDEVILAVNHLADQMQQQIGEERNGSKIIYSIEREPLGTGGPIRLASELLGSDPFIVLNGDIVSNVDLNQMLQTHEKAHAGATIALVEAADPSPYGQVQIKQDGVVEQFVEKTQTVKGPGLVNAGVYVLTSEVVKKIPERGMVSIERGVFPDLAKENRMQGFQHTNGYWFDIGKIPDYIRANEELLQKSWFRVESNIKMAGGPFHIGKESKIDESAQIGPFSILSDNVAVGRDSSIKNSIIFEESSIGENCRIEGSVIGEKVRLGDHVHLGPGSLVAGQISIPSGRDYGSNAVILNA